MGERKPVVSFTEGLADEEHARDALVPVAVRTADALADGIEPLLLDPSRRAELGAAGRALVESPRFGVERDTRHLEELLLGLTAGQSSGT